MVWILKLDNIASISAKFGNRFFVKIIEQAFGIGIYQL